MNTPEDAATEPAYRIEVLRPSFDSFGLVLDLLSRHPPFAEWPLERLAKAIRKQLRLGQQIAALSPGDDLLAYAGWVPSLQASAELWMENRGPLQMLDQGGDARAVTIFVSTQPIVTKAMVRHARALAPDIRWYFKRTYGDKLRVPRKDTVRNRGAVVSDTNDS